MLKNNRKGIIIKVLSFSLIFSTIIIVLLLSNNHFYANMTTSNNDKSSNYIKLSAKDLVIPNKEIIFSDGYPTNESGLTYGPDLGNLLLTQPNLMLAEGEDGILGYIYESKGISSPSESVNYEPPKSTPLYLQDGKTIIGTFYFN